MRLYFVHGWAFGPECFDALAPLLADWPQVRADLGYFGAAHFPEFAPGDVLVGHSAGFSWGLSQRQDWAGLVAINSFSRFVRDEEGRGCVRAAELRALRRGVARDTKNCVDEFRARHGGGACSTPNGEALTKGLDFLDAFDIRRFAGLDCFASLAMTAEPMADKRSTLVLASEDDPLVPLDAGRELAQIGGDLFVSATGGHGLPLRAPGFCAEKIGDFLRRHGW